MIAVRPGKIRSLFWAAFLPAYLAATLAGSLFWAGCTKSAPPSGPAPSPAHLTVINLTDYEWRIVVSRPTGAFHKDARLQRRATVTLEVPGGDYVVEQIALVESTGPDLTRIFPIKLESGQTYRWPIATLLSDAAEGAGAK